MAATDPRRRQPPPRARWALVCTALAVLLLPVGARGDRASGTWTGVAEVRGNYYYEQSTRVVAPATSVDLESPSGVRLHGDYLVDSITSASVGAGARTDVAFTEIRHQAGLGGGYAFDLDQGELELTGSFRASREPDYRSLGGGLSAALSLNERSTVLRLNTFFVRDRIEELLRGADGMAGNLSDRGVVGYLNSLVAGLVWEQVLTPALTAQVGYDFGYLTGYLQNPYRFVSVGGVTRQENHPDERFRHTVTGRLAYYIRATGTAIHAIYRTYLDSWDIAALTPEGRVYQELGRHFVLRLRYRHYTQTRSFFARAPSEYGSEDEYITADPKMTRFHNHLVGAQVLLQLGFLEDTFLHFADEATLDLSFERIWNTNRFGNGVIAQAGFRLPF
ncbi:MAG: DUF3570 domain-containing protein [Myxococcota bacterium]